jgi:hypothetical protein
MLESKLVQSIVSFLESWVQISSEDNRTWMKILLRQVLSFDGGGHKLCTRQNHAVLQEKNSDRASKGYLGSSLLSCRSSTYG